MDSDLEGLVGAVSPYLLLFGIFSAIVVGLVIANKVITWCVFWESGKWQEYRVCPCRRGGTEYEYIDNYCQTCGRELPHVFVVARVQMRLLGYYWQLSPEFDTAEIDRELTRIAKASK